MTDRRPVATRRFFLGSLAATGALSLTSRVHASPNEEVRLAIIGSGGRGGELANATRKCTNARVVTTCDPDIKRAGQLAEKFDAKAESDLRVALEDPNVDAVMIATCNHWHCLAAMWAMDAGKDVYVEKPLSHSQWEGRQVVRMSRKTGRIVQLGTQQRSDPIQMQAREFLHDKKALGEIQYVQANRLGPRGPIGRRDTPLPIPSEVNYDLWLGPAADQPIFRDSLHYDWHWDWNTGSGEMGNWGVHVLDDVRNVAYQDQCKTPKRIFAAGGRVAWDDAGESPNIHVAVLETDTFPTLMALSNLPSKPGGKGAFKVLAGKPVHGGGSGYVIVCDGGYYLGQRGSGEAVDRDGKRIRQFKADTDIIPAHVQNFIDAVRNRDRDSLAAEIEVGHDSTGWCNLANVAFRAAGELNHDRLMAASDIPAWRLIVDEIASQMEPFGVTADELRCSEMLTHDVETETFVGDGAEAANVFLKRDYRAGYEVASV